jgi:hypothetical protein
MDIKIKIESGIEQSLLGPQAPSAQINNYERNNFHKF